jgi:CDP-diacylglycerol--serine O-phosphatidyltransferase
MTLGNGICGFAAIACASQIGPNPESDIYFAYAGWLIFVAMLFDVMDGYTARMLRAATDFGGQLDSLCDAISFGAAPAFMLLRLAKDWQTSSVAPAALLGIVAAIYMSCAILRLARFNVENSPDPAYHKRFKGLPSPVAAGCLASLAILRGSGSAWAESEGIIQAIRLWAPLGALLVAVLMVSRVSYPHLTRQLVRGQGRYLSPAARILIALALVLLLQQVTLLVVFWGYTLIILARYLLLRAFRHELPAAPPARLDDILRR